MAFSYRTVYHTPSTTFEVGLASATGEARHDGLVVSGLLEMDVKEVSELSSNYGYMGSTYTTYPHSVKVTDIVVERDGEQVDLAMERNTLDKLYNYLTFTFDGEELVQQEHDYT